MSPGSAQPPPTTPPPQGQPPPASAAAAGIMSGAAVGAVPPIATTAEEIVGTAAIAAAVTAIVASFAAFFVASRRGVSQRLMDTLRKQHPELGNERLRELVRQELAREREFQKKMLERLRRDLPVALRIADPRKRAARVQQIIAREKRYIGMREEAMAERAMATIEHDYVKADSPEGAFWMLDDSLASHTPGCVAMANQPWPWEVLDVKAPPVHHGCGCYLIGIPDAIARDLMREDQIPDTPDAIRRAKDAADAAYALEQAMYEGEWTEYCTELRESYDIRYPAGTHEGGKFMPRRGGLGTPTIRRPVHRALRALIPTSPEPPRQQAISRRGAWRWAGGRLVHIPAHRQFSRTIGGVHYTSPPNSTNLYVDGTLHHEERGMHDSPGALVPIGTMADPGILQRVFRAGHSEPDALRAVPEGEPPQHEGPPANFEDFKHRTFDLAKRIGFEYKAPVDIRTVATDPTRWDHAGFTDFDGNVRFGRDVEPDIDHDAVRREVGGVPDDSALASTYADYKVQAHEALHTVNPISSDEFGTPTGSVLEEGLSEELGHIIARQQLAADGRRDVVRWANRNRDNLKVQGSYLVYRQAIAKTLDYIGAPKGKAAREAILFDLKLKVPPGKRLDKLEQIAQERKGEKAPTRDQIEEHLIGSLATALPGPPQDPGAAPAIAHSQTDDFEGEGFTQHHFVARDRNGTEIGRLDVNVIDGANVVESVGVDREHRRQGIASALYSAATQKLGPIEHSEWQTTDGAAWMDAVGGKRHGDPRDWRTTPGLDHLGDFDMFDTPAPAPPRLPPPRLSVEVASINTAKDAEAYLATRGVKSNLEIPPGSADPGVHNSAVFYRQIAQAVTDAQDRFPSLKGRLAEVTFVDHLKEDMDPLGYSENSKNGVWATTGSMPMLLTKKGQPITIAINNHDDRYMAGSPAEAKGSDGIAVADQNAYGSMMHELGHAVAVSSGLTTRDTARASGPLEIKADQTGEAEVNLYESADWTPFDAQQVSAYGASGVFESWAEMFTTLNTPGAMDALDPSTRRKLETFQGVANQWAQTHLQTNVM